MQLKNVLLITSALVCSFFLQSSTASPTGPDNNNRYLDADEEPNTSSSLESSIGPDNSINRLLSPLTRNIQTPIDTERGPKTFLSFQIPAGTDMNEFNSLLEEIMVEMGIPPNSITQFTPSPDGSLINLSNGARYNLVEEITPETDLLRNGNPLPGETKKLVQFYDTGLDKRASVSGTHDAGYEEACPQCNEKSSDPTDKIKKIYRLACNHPMCRACIGKVSRTAMKDASSIEEYTNIKCPQCSECIAKAHE